MTFAILIGEKRHMWDDFENSKVLLDGFKTKADARDWLSVVAKECPWVTHFTVAAITTVGIRLAAGPTNRNLITKEN